MDNEVKVPSTLERIENLEKGLSEIGSNMNFIIQQLGSTMQQAGAVEQTALSLGKTLTAVVKVLVAKETLTSREVLDEIIKIDESSDRDELAQMRSSGVIVPVEQVSENSVVVAAHTLIEKDGSTRMLSNFNLVRMFHPFVPEQLKKDLLGRKVSDTLPMSRDSGDTTILTVLEIYDPNPQRQVSGEPESAQPTEGGDAQ